jgi:hypothetical protein
VRPQSTLQKARPNAWGGARVGAGRKKSSHFEPHTERPRLSGLRRPVHLKLKVKSAFAELTAHESRVVFARAAARARRFGLRLIHFGLLQNELHLVAEFKNNKDLESSLKSLTTTLAIYLKRRLALKNKWSRAPKGRVFLDRFSLSLVNTEEVLKNVFSSIVSLGAQLALKSDIKILASPQFALTRRWLHNTS